ncbi:NAD(P)H-dependent flavin oxidoreductase YrpB (nitropropane dioxygenase family) [Acidovorax soli]|uniref:NAD(P)H-dependent flavin oxidoreductase YrpB (Nitropropane dioxygenase family) n=1 Tax=Acidovorax soli TaxID=592050 RepID=A0A7X0U8W0_9BURK|nr:hypothetical protein [Acidovorax soli]MBB6558870.1 NAD(P)H-dependent flavin oxidoreductase YrpB (nitropropane dioxygenase family) [Acidovorax soli]
MTPSLPVPTDNIYKFSALFGLALVVSGIFAFTTVYTSSLEKKIKYTEAMIGLEARTTRTKLEDDTLAFNRRLVEVTQSNEMAANYALGGLIALGLVLSFYGALRWHQVIQPRDDEIARLQKEKLEAEIAKLQTEADRSVSQQPPPPSATRRSNKKP